jgi:hypothetical protein
VTPELAALLAAIGFTVIAVFQVVIALGAPLGRAAWGGAHIVLPRNLRVASAVAVVIWVVAALVVLDRAGTSIIDLPDAVTSWGTWALVVVLPIGALMNFASSSPYERFGWGPLALVLAMLTLILALS